jgi:Protein of unknown function (DUF2490)
LRILRRLLLLMLLVPLASVHGQDQNQFWPEVDSYVNLSSRTRLFFIAALSSDQDTKELQGEFGSNFDFYLRPLLRPRLRDLDPAKSKFLSFRVGYRYYTSLHGENPSENRAIVESTPRFYLPLAILLSDRNRVDFRFVSDKPYSWRYRNRLSLERNFSIRKYKFTPYVRGEFFYDSRFDKIAKNAFTVGSVFPLSERTEFEAYFQDQRDSATVPNYHTRGVGVVLGLYF